MFSKPLLLLYICVANQNIVARAVSEHGRFRVMTFNTWDSGTSIENGVAKIAKHINRLNPDVVMLQEIMGARDYDTITQAMGKDKWKGYYRSGFFPDNGVLTRHHLYADTYAQTDFAMGIKIRVANGNGNSSLSASYTNISVWSAHLQSQPSGPDAACNHLVTSDTVLMAGEMNLGNFLRPGRIQNVMELLANSAFRQALEQSDNEPIVLAGDFNTPSHEDWTEETKDLHCGWAYNWPATKTVTDIGFRDSFRTLHPDPRRNPGWTWSTVQKLAGSDFGWMVPEPQDRIDFIFWRGASLQPNISFVYSGDKHIDIKPYCYHNDWPSDHAAVVTDFLFKL